MKEKSKKDSKTTSGTTKTSSSSPKASTSSSSSRTTTFQSSAGGSAIDRIVSDYRITSGGGGKVTDPKTGLTYDAPSYSASSFRGLTSTDPANVARNREAAQRYSMIGAGAGASREGGGGSNAPAAPTAPVASAPEPVQIVAEPSIPAVPQAPKKVNPSDMTSTGPSEDLALESAKQGRKATILTSGQGVGDEPAGLLRRRRSLVGGRIQ